MDKIKKLYLPRLFNKKNAIKILLWTPFVTLFAMTIESLYWLSKHFEKIILIPDRHVLEALLFTLMIPTIYWYKKCADTAPRIIKYTTLIVIILTGINFVKYILIIGVLLYEEIVK